MNYGNFAYIYDQLMQDIPYDEWIKYINQILEIHKLKPIRVLDLGCGTCNVSLPLAQQGMEVTAIDLSSDMLTVASEKAHEKKVSIQLVQQDIRELEVLGKYDLVLSMCDSLNYLASLEELEEVFSRVYKVLNTKGLFIFDLNTFYKISEVFGDEIYFLNEEDISYIWENSYDSQNERVTMEISFFVKRPDGNYVRFVETHKEKGFHMEDVVTILNKTGFKNVDYYNELTFDKPSKTTERIYYIVEK